MALIQIEDGDWINTEHVSRWSIQKIGDRHFTINMYLNGALEYLRSDFCLISGFDEKKEAEEYLFYFLQLISSRDWILFHSLDQFRTNLKKLNV